MANICYFDIETKSGYDLKQVGAAKYFGSKRADLVCLAYNTNKTNTNLWIPGLPVPEPFLDPSSWIFVALNIQFDMLGINTVGVSHGFRHILPENCIDVMALLAKYTLPQGLDAAGKILKVKIPKMKEGKDLKKKICIPPFESTKEEMRMFYRYCITDVNSMIQVIQALPSEKLDPVEQRIWLDTVDINRRGIPIDLKTAIRVNETVKFYIGKRTKGLPLLTMGAVAKPTQVKRIRDWMSNEYDIETDDLKASTVETLLADEDLPMDVRDVLDIRQDIGGAAVKKYKRLIPQVYYGRIYSNLRYGAASTLRFGGLGFQVHNLPRASVDDPDHVVGMFENTNILFKPYTDKEGKEHDLMTCAKALIRPCIQAPKGKELLAGDFGSVEAVYLMWMAGEIEVLKRLAKGFDMYKDMASDLYEVPYDQITYEQRFLGKTLVLGAGYNLAWRGFIGYARGYGLHITEDMAKRAINKYRAKHRRVVELWYGLKAQAMNAVKNPNQKFSYKKFMFITKKDRRGNKWLMMYLPSGSILYYAKPFIRDGKYGPTVSHYGVNSTTKQWTVKDLIPGRITENADQRLSRDRLCFSVRKLIEADYHPIFHVHDEVVNEEKIGEKKLQDMIDIMCINPDWCPDLPLGADGYVANRYMKG